MSSLKIRGAWGGSAEAGSTRESVAAYAERLANLGINAIFIGLKEGDGRICWPSEQFAAIVKPEYRDFDLPAVMQEEFSKRGIECHAWFIDYFEGEQGVAFTQHPEWAATNSKGQTTAEEVLRGSRFGCVWMCPARRPGYTDQWLVPLYEEFAARYKFASIHHDYIRYPGDMAPDQYCFCDYCLENIPSWAGFINEAFPDEAFYHESYDRPYLEAHWEQSPRVLPANWAGLGREFKSRFLLEGSFFQTGRADLDHFFYEYRMHWITEFARLSHEAMKRVNPSIKKSGAVFKNPIQSGRFIGQDWRRFTRYMEIAVPMNYRDHFPGTFDQYLGLLAEAIGRQKVWARECENLYIGTAINFLFKEENGRTGYPPEKVERVVETIAAAGADGAVLFSTWQFEEFGVSAAIAKAFGA